MEILEWLHLLSASVKLTQLSLSAVNNLFIAYVIVSIFIKKSRYLMAFCLCVAITSLKGFEFVLEYQLYLTSFIVYSYVTIKASAKKTKISCVIMCILSLILAHDAYKYGVNGTHGARETAIYKNIEYLATYANIIIILSLVSFRRIYNGICRFFDAIIMLSGCSSYMFIFCYNIYKIKSTR